MILIAHHGADIASIGLNRPDKRNAINVEMTLAIEAALIDLKYNSAIKTLIFHGIGPHFCAGMDLKDFFDSSTRSPQVLAKAKAATEHWRTRLLPSMPQTLISAVSGYCFGAALPFLAHSTHVIADQHAVFGLPEVNFAFAPGPQILKAVSQRMHDKALAYAVLTGRQMSAEQALRWGLVDGVVEGDVLGEAVRWAGLRR